MELEKLRQQIDEIDEKMRDLLARRMQLSAQVGEYKKKVGLPIFHPEREKEVLEKNVSKMLPEEYRPAYREILIKIMETSRRIQGNLLYDQGASEGRIDLEGFIKNQQLPSLRTVGYQGIPGSYSSEALEWMVKDKRTERKHYPTFRQATEALADGEITDLILPIENSSTGGVKDVEHLIATGQLYISGEWVLSINHALLGIPTADIQQIRKVYSHSQALSQCSRFIEEHGFLAEPYYNTAMSAKMVQETNDPRIGAIASLQAGQLYGLKTLAESIGDNGTNYTRFVRVTKSPEIDARCNKISIRLSVAHEIGSLYRIINIITESSLNMTRIESRPIYGKPWEYYFFIDFEGNIMEERVRKAMDRMMDNSTHFDFLGNYPKGA